MYKQELQTNKNEDKEWLRLFTKKIFYTKRYIYFYIIFTLWDVNISNRFLEKNCIEIEV